MKKYRAWHFLQPDGCLAFDGRDLGPVEAGYIYSIGEDETPELCRRGMHASIRPLDALSYAKSALLARVDVYGDVLVGDDKICGRHRHILAVENVEMLLHRFACWCARNTPTGNGKTTWDLLTNARSRAAVEVKEKWISGGATDAELSAARDAAWAAQAAWAAAWAAARAAAWAAARAAARAAAWAAARAAARAAQNEQLKKMLAEVF